MCGSRNPLYKVKGTPTQNMGISTFTSRTIEFSTFHMQEILKQNAIIFFTKVRTYFLVITNPNILLIFKEKNI